MKVLMMDYVRNKSLGEYDWKATSLESFRSCCKQVVCIMLDAHEATGYRHSDLHSKNVLVKRSTCKSVRYACGATVAVRGFKAVIMDLEMSSFRQPVAKFFWDLEEFFGSLAYKVRIADATTVIPIKRMLMDFIENRNECAAAMQLLPLVDRIEFV
jgi:tRNA A-37 threonylcarbamoyl transferase component Bud32